MMKKDITIYVNSKTSMVDLHSSRLGISGENLQGNLIVKFDDEFVNGTAILEIQRNNEKYYLTMQKSNESYYLPILSSLLTIPTTIIMQVRITEGTDAGNIPVWKSNKFYLKVEEAINAEIPIPQEYAEWIDIANEKLNEIDNLDIDATKTGSTATVSIINKEGITKSVEIIDGENGQDGYSPTAIVSKSGNTSTITITDKNGTTTASVNDGINGIDGIDGKDAKINGVNTLSIEAGTNISIDQQGSTLTINSTGGGGTSDYSDLTNKPSINNVTLSGNKTLSDLGIQPAGNYALESEIPTKTSDLINDSDFITPSYHDNTKQDITDNTLTTTNKTIPTAINEVNSIAKGANQAVGYNNYSDMITALNAMDDEEYNVGQNVYIVTVNVPDLWVSSVESTSSTYTYVDDATVINDLETNGYIQVGYYKLSMLETQKADLTNYVANTDYAGSNKAGVIRTNPDYGTSITSVGALISATKTYRQYQDTTTPNMFISKGTLENVITGKGLVSNTDFANNTTAGVIRTSGSYGTTVSGSGVLNASTLSYKSYSEANNTALVGKGTLENVIAGKKLNLKQLSTFDNTKTQVLKNINGTLTWVDE